MSTLDKKYYHNIDLDSNELKSGRIYNVTTSDRANLKTYFLANTPANFKGYIVYDINLNILYTWNGSDWTTAAGGSGTVTSVSAGTGMSFTAITGAGSVSIDTSKVPYISSGVFSTGLLKWDGTAWVFDNSTYLTSAVTSLSATSPITASASTGSVTISTSMSANKLIGRSTTGTGVMEEIALGTGLSFSGTTLNATGASPLTTKGDLFTYSTTNARLPIGSDTHILIADSTQPTGIKWGSNTAATPTGYYGAFQDNTSQTAASINTAYPVKFNTTDLTNGVSIVNDVSGNPTRVTLANTGIYNIQFSLQLEKTSGSGNMIADIWIRNKGVDIPSTTGKVVLTGNANASPVIAAWNYVLDLAAGDYIQLMWATTNTNVEIIAAGATSPHPAIPSAILTVTQQSGIMAGTGVTGLGTSGNIQTGTTQTLATGTSGTTFNIASSGNTQTFNIPLASTASVTAGLISKTDYDTFTGKQATITGAATTITSSDLTVSKALVSNTSGKVTTSTVSSVELSYVAGVTSAIQTQLNSKLSTISGIAASGNLTGTYPSPTIASGVVTLDNMNKIAANSIIGNNTGALATPIALSGTQVTAMLDIFNGTTKGLVPVNSAGSLSYFFLASDGNWQKIGTSAIADQAPNTIIANTTGSSASPSAVGIATITPQLDTVVGDSGSGGTKGLVPTPAAGDASAGKFLKADGTWAVPAGGGGGGTTTNSFIIKADSGTIENTDLYTFNGSSAKTINIVAGTNITITKASGTLTVSSTAGSTPSSYNYIMSTYFS